MAIISSYPVSTPQFADQVLGTNTVDASGSAVIGNPTVQYTLSSVKTLVDQQFIQQLSSSSNNNAQAAIQADQSPGGTNTAYQILFGAADSTNSNVTIDAAGKVVFLTTGTYFITQEYYLGATTGDSLLTLFRTYQNATTQIGPTHVEKYVVQATSDRKKIVIQQMVNITVGGTFYGFQMLRDSGGADAGKLYQTLNNNGWTTTANAQLIISKLI